MNKPTRLIYSQLFRSSLLIPLMVLILLMNTSSSVAGIQKDFTNLSIEELMNIEITSVSKKPERLGDASAAIFVITQEDIRRSGVTSIPEALRMVPGIHVGRIDTGTWAITSRGFNGRFANKLLVLIDGRSVYTPTHSGVYWELQDTLLEDVDRIEVIRGPGASLWGANAVNGIINVITYNAADTQGGLATAGGGTEEKGFGSLRYGGTISDKAFYRIYAKYSDRDGFVDTDNNNTPDDREIQQGGFRLDWEPETAKKVTFQGDIFSGDSGRRYTLPSLTAPPDFEIVSDEDVDYSGGNLIARMQVAGSENSEMILQSYYDWTDYNEVTLDEKRQTFDIDFQHRLGLCDSNELTWGLGYRYTRDDFKNTFYISIFPYEDSNQLFSGFIQDKIQIKPNKIFLILGSKFEHNDYTGSEIQPTARFLWTPDEQHSFWTAVSRAVRTPSRIEASGQLQNIITPSVPPLNLPGLVNVQGTSDYDSEELIAYEIGMRAKLRDNFTIDISSFFNDYSKLRTVTLKDPYFGDPSETPHLVIPYDISNKMTGSCYGVEVAAGWHLLQWWRLQATYSFMKMRLNLDNNSGDIVTEVDEDANPDHQASLRSSMNVMKNIEIDLWLRFVDTVSAGEILNSAKVDSYTTMDARIAWKPTPKLEFSIVGQNLLSTKHQEYSAEVFIWPPVEIERGAYAKVAWIF